MPIQVLTCKWSASSATLPEYSESPAQLSLEDSPYLCQCVSASAGEVRESSLGESAVVDGE